MTEKVKEDAAEEVQAESLDVNIDTTHLESEIKNLIETVKETQEIKDDDKTVSDLIDYLADEKEKSEEEKQELEEKEEQRINEIKDLLEDEELTEEEKEELEIELKREEDLIDLSESYYSYMANNAESNHLEIIESLEELQNKLEFISIQNDLTNQSDGVIIFYGTIVFPALVIVFLFYRFFSWFL